MYKIIPRGRRGNFPAINFHEEEYMRGRVISQVFLIFK